MTQNYRLDNIGLINRDKKLSFKFNGVTYFGYEGYSLSRFNTGHLLDEKGLGTKTWIS